MNKIKLISLAASISLALAFTLSCSNTDSLDLPPPENCVPEPDNTTDEELGPTVELDVIIRDFPVDYPGFEEFDSDKGSSGMCAGSDPEFPNSITNDDNAICFIGSDYVPCSQGGTQLQYGEVNNRRGFINGPDGMNPQQIDVIWSNKIWVTKGMVQNKLDYSLCDAEEKMGNNEIEKAINGRYCARPKKGNGNCYGDGIESWFSDGGKAKRIEDILTLDRTNDGLYERRYDYNTLHNWNDYGQDNGFFPLDKFDDSRTWGKQSLSVWCPPITNSYTDANCIAWKNNGGPNDPDAARITAAPGNRNIMNKLHNYHFTLAGAGVFKYNEGQGEVFEFLSNDDMWIFIDGELVVDLGGNHIPAPAKINIDNLAAERGRRGGWQDGSEHAINFFYANRQTEGSAFRLKIGLAGLSPARFCRQP